ncbi:MAG: HD domain-containing protein [Melioribacteraceae bacterium]|nr:HD domain-containing protein [Melioribacteraceae bacterium]
MIEQKKVNQLKPGDTVFHFLLKRKSELKITKSNRQFLDLELGDETGYIPAKVWEGFQNLKITDDSVKILKVAGTVDEYQGSPQVKVDKIRPALPEDNINVEDFLPKSKRSLELMLSELNERIDKISNPFINQLLSLIFDSDNLDKYKRVPAGKAWHHAYIHGLLEHTLEIVKICDLMCDIHPEIKRDTLICGALLHDFGKIEELIYDSNFDYSDKGKLIGHIVIAALLIEKKADQINGFPQDLKNQIIHLVLSHQGKLEFASPVEPKTLEAIVLYHADELSAKTNAYKQAIKAEEKSGKSWTRFLPLAGTSLMIPKETEDEAPKESLFD